jgi:hypothetical protein
MIPTSHKHDPRPYAVHNPQAKPMEDLPAIYGFNNGSSVFGMDGTLLAADGTFLGGHCCSSEHYMLGDLGCVEGSRPDRHETFREHYPDGYRMEFVTYDDVPGHAGLQEAFKLASAKAEAERDA